MSRVRSFIRKVDFVLRDAVTMGAMSRREQAKREEEYQREQQRLLQQQQKEQEAEEKWQQEQAQISGQIQGTQQGNMGYTGSGATDYDFVNALSNTEDEDDILKRSLKRK